jgi:hypothetical protein
MDALQAFREVWLCDCEFRQPDGERPDPLCLVAREWRSGRTVRLWQEELTAAPAPPFPLGPDTLFVAYFASAELGCFLALDWSLPARIVDLSAEFRNHTSGLTVPCGKGVLGALTYYGLDGLSAIEKQRMQELAMRGGPYTVAERRALLDYCEKDVIALDQLLPAMLPRLDLPRALLRGRYLPAVAKMESAGVPIDTKARDQLRANWERIKGRLIDAVNRDYGVYVPAKQRTLDPGTVFGEAVLRVAREWDLDPYQLAEAAEYVWRQECAANAEVAKAVAAARKATGLTVRRIQQWEDQGGDYSTWPVPLDTPARELAGAWPALGIGPGYTADGGADDTDHAAALWERLRTETERPPPKHDRDILGRAAEWLAADGGSDIPSTVPMSFSVARWTEWLARNRIPWPRLPSGKLDLRDACFREMARAYPEQVGPIRELRHALSQLRLSDLAVGSDGRNRSLLAPFGSCTGRNQPSNTRYIFGSSTWLRGLIRPDVGMAIAYLDYEQQEFGIAAALSGDAAMMTAYRSGDPYLTFAQQAGAVPPHGTKQTHKAERERFKVLSLAVQYGAGPNTLARQLDEAPARGRELIGLHKATYPKYSAWSDAVEMTAMLSGRLQAAYGWTVHVGPDANPRSLRNFPLQANGAEMLRLACIWATEQGIRVCAPVHDALLIEAPADEIEQAVAAAQRAMVEASQLVLPGFPLRTEAKVVRWPERYSDPRGERFWRTVWELIGDGPAAPALPPPLALALPPPLALASGEECSQTGHVQVPERDTFCSQTGQTVPYLLSL